MDFSAIIPIILAAIAIGVAYYFLIYKKKEPAVTPPTPPTSENIEVVPTESGNWTIQPKVEEPSDQRVG